MKRLLNNSKETYRRLYGQSFDGPIEIFEGVSSRDLYYLRRDCCGKSASQIVDQKVPAENMNLLGAFLLLIISQGSLLDERIFRLSGRRLRIFNGAGKLISEVKQILAEESPTLFSYDAVICVGAKDDGGVPRHLVRSRKPDIVRSGTTGSWMNEDGALSYLGIVL